MSRSMERYDDGDQLFSYTSRSVKRGKFSQSQAPIGSREKMRRLRRREFGSMNQRRNKHWAW